MIVNRNFSTVLTINGGFSVDDWLPVITLNKSHHLTLVQGSVFYDPGYRALSSIYGDISADIIVAGDVVNTAVIGDYIITYNVTDASANIAIEVTRTVSIVAATVISKLSIIKHTSKPITKTILKPTL